MADILPEPKDNMQASSTNSFITKRSYRIPTNKRTIAVLVGLVILAVLALAAGYIYDVISTHNSDNTRKQDLSYISTTVNSYYDLNHYYPTLVQLNSSTFSIFLPSLNYTKFKDPNSNTSKLSATPAANRYAYEVSPTNCNNKTVPCTGYKLVATLSSGQQYVLTSPASKK
ncbi:MAG: type II secretion system protein [Candidatus Saccharimonadales bacterium]